MYKSRSINISNQGLFSIFFSDHSLQTRSRETRETSEMDHGEESDKSNNLRLLNDSHWNKTDRCVWR